MRLQRSDVIPLLAIVAGVGVGSLVVRSRAAPSHALWSFSGSPGAFQELMESDVLLSMPVIRRESLIRLSPSDGPQLEMREGPLLVVDGAVVDAAQVEELDRNEIESVGVIKGAKAIALYGDRASNGVVLIVTKAEERRKALYLKRGLPVPAR